MYIWIQDHSWSGMLVVIAKSEAEAREIMKEKGSWTYSSGVPIEKHEIVDGLFLANYGDA